MPGVHAGQAGLDGNKNKKQQKTRNKRGAARRGAAVPPSCERGWPFRLPVEADGVNRSEKRIGNLTGWQTRHRRKPDCGRSSPAKCCKVDFPADRLRVRAERLYFIPEELPDFGNFTRAASGRLAGDIQEESVSNRPTRWRCSCSRDRPNNVLDLPSAEKRG